MEPNPAKLHYKRSKFSTHLPAAYLYSPSHFWLAGQEDGSWRIGITKFAGRMLGEMVDHGFEVEPGTAVELGQIIGWVEGFKAISDVFCVVDGAFLEGNAALQGGVALMNKDCYGAGWLYRAAGRPDPKCVDVRGYADLLDKAIDRILEKQQDGTNS